MENMFGAVDVVVGGETLIVGCFSKDGDGVDLYSCCVRCSALMLSAV